MHVSVFIIVILYTYLGYVCTFIVSTIDFSFESFLPKAFPDLESIINRIYPSLKTLDRKV